MLGGRDRLELAYSLMLSLPGAPVLRYGEEIGMGDDLRLKERNAIRTPMQWSAGEGAGFSTAEKLVRPLIDRGPYGYQAVNVESQLRDPSSLLRFVMRMIRVRKECPEIGAGEWRALATRRPQVLALQYTGPASSVVCLHNLAHEPVEATFALDVPLLESLLGSATSTAENGRHTLRLEPYGYEWLRAAT